VAFDQLAREAVRLDDNTVCEWTQLARLDAIDVGEQLGLLSDRAARTGLAADRR
jgi:hypothetical protein